MTYLILQTLANGRTKHIEVTAELVIDAQQGANYTLIDSETQQPPKNLKIVKKGNVLVIEDDGKELASIDNFFDENSNATFTTDGSAMVSDAAPANIISNQSVLAAAIGDEAIIWSADASGSEGLFGFDPSTLAMAGGALLTGGLSSVNLFSQAADNAPLLTPRALAPTLTLTVDADIATAAEATAGAVNVATAVGETIAVVFSNGANNVTVNLTGDGTTQAVVLSVVDQATLGDGSITVDATSTDAAGITATATTSFVLDTVASAAPNIVVAAAATNATEGEAIAGAVTVDPAVGDSTDVVFTGSAGSVTVTVAGTGAAQSVSLSAADVATLGDGTITVDATTTDAAGNVSAAAAQSSFILDTVAPTAPVLTISAANSLASTNEALAGVLSVSPALGETTQVTFTNAAGTPINVTIVGNGSAQPAILTAADLAVLGDGTIDVNAVTLDVAGNVTTALVSTSFVLDTAGPATPVIALTTDSALADGITNVGTLTTTGAEANGLVEYSINGGTTWAATFTAAEGVNNVMVRQTDEAGNVSPASAPLTFTFDSQVAAPSVALSNDTGLAAGDNITNDAALAFSGVETGALVEYSTDAGTTWTTNYTAVEGANSVQIRQTDVAGNVSPASAALTFTLDTTAPAIPSIALTTDSALADGISNVGTLTTTGNEAGALVEYSTDGGTNWSATFSAIEGANSVQVRQTDVAGNVSTASAALTFTLDTIVAPPSISLTTDSGSSLTDGITNVGTLNLTGAEAGAVVEYSTDGGTTWVGSFTAIEGANSVQVRQTDVAGNVSTASAALTFTLDTIAPVAAPTLSLTNDTGLAAADSITNDGALSTAGVDANALVEYSVDAGLTWATTFSAVEGANSVIVRQTDVAGNVSPASAALTFTLDTGAPATPVIALTSDSGVSAVDGISNVGTLATTGAEAGALVEYSIDAGLTWTAAFAAVEGANSVMVRQTDVAGNVSAPSAALDFTLDTAAAAPSVALNNDTGLVAGDNITSDAALAFTGVETGALVEYSIDAGVNWTASFAAAEGANSVIVRQTDVAGNISASSAPLAFTLDTAAPATPVIALTTDSGISAADGISNIGTLTTTGGEAGALVEYSVDAGVNWTASFTAAEGANSVMVRQTDVAGNVSPVSAPLAFTLDTTVAAPTVALTNDTGVLATDSITSDGALTVSGTELNALVEYSIDNGANWSAIFTAAEGANSVMVRQTDEAGNVSTASTALTFTLDTAIPLAPTVALNNDTGVAGDLISNDGTLNVGSEAGALVEYSIDAGATWTTTFTAAEGANSVMVRQTDAAGNVSPASAAFDFNLDTQVAAPSVVLNFDSAAVGDGITNDGAIIVTGNEAGALVEYSIDGGTTWTASFTAAEGANSVVVRQTDSAGNVSAASTPLSFTLDTLVTAPTLSLTNDTGTAGDNITSDAALTLTGGEAGALIEYSIDAGTTWTTTFTAVEGANSVMVRQTDVAGNVSAASAPLAFTLNTVAGAPSVTLTNDTSTVGDNITSDGALTVAGTSAGALIEYSLDSGATWTGTFTAAEGSNSVIVRQTDVAGNVSAASTPLDFTLDTAVVAPTVALTNDTATAADNISSDGALTVSGTEVGALVEYSIDAGATWTTTFTAAEGTNSVQVRQTDVAGNVSAASAALAFTLDTQVAAPSLALSVDSGVAGDALSNDGALAVTGAEVGALVEYSIDAGATWATTFTATEGANSVIARQTDVAGNVSAASAAFDFTLDTAATAPTVALNNDTGIAGDNITSDGALLVSGTEVGALIEYSIDAGLNWTASFTAVEGANSVLVRQTDVAGNVSAASQLDFTLNTTIPGTLSLALSVDSGLAADNVSNDGTLAVTGAIAGNTVQYSTDAGLTWAATFTATEGANSVIARQTDAAGNVSAASTPFDFTLDTLVSAPTVSLTNDTGLAADNISSDGALTVAAEAGALVEYSIDAGLNWTTTFTAIEGANSVMVRQTDVAGNVSAASAALDFTLDTIAPTAPTASVSATNAIATAAEAALGAVEITALAGDTVVVTFSDGITSIPVTVIGTGAPQAVALSAAEIASLGDGTINISAVTTDVAGNISAAATTSFVLDTAAASTPILTVSAATAVATAAEAITGAVTIDPAVGETSVVFFSNGPSIITKTVIGDGTAQVVTLTAAEVATLGDGIIYLSASNSDLAGNYSTSATTSFTLDTVAPNAPTLTAVAGADFATAAEAAAGAVTVNPAAGETADVVFTGVAGSVTVTVIGDGTAQAAVLSAADLATLGDGTITVDATNIDGAGNVSAGAVQSSFVLDTLAPNVPTVTVLPGADISTSAEAQAGSVEVLAATGDVVDITFTDINNVQVVKQITGNATGSAQVIALTAAELGGLADGTITVSSTTTDLAGNVSSASNSFILSTVAPTAPVVTLVAGADFATAAEASAGVVTVSPATGETTDVVFSNGVNSVTVSIIGDGTAQSVVLSAADQALLADGTITIDATSTNAAGTVSAAAIQSSFVLDTVAPTAPALTIVAGADIATAAEATAGAVSVTPLAGETTSVVFSNALAGTSVTVSIIGDGTTQAVVLSAADQATLADGIITVDATTSDQAGNVSVAAAQASFTLDTAAPATPTLTLVAGADFATAAEALAGAAELTATAGEVVTVTFTGTAGTVTQTINATGTPQALTLTANDLISLGEGAVSVDASITDLAGNVSSAATNFTLDTVIATTPVFTVVAGADLATAAEASAGAISIAPATGESTDVVFSNAAGTSVTITVVGDGTAQAVALSAADLVTLGDGTIDVNAVSTDLAGNVSTAATPSSFVLDTVGPVAPTVAVTPAGSIATAVEAAAGAVEVTAAVGEVTSVVFTGALGTVTLSVTGTGAAQAVALTAAQIATLGDGAVTVDASNTDLAGNLATTSTSFTLDTLSAATPILTITDANATSAVAAGTVSIAPAVGETTTVIFTNGSNAVNTTVIKIIIGTGAAQTVTLTAADLTTLGEGTIFLNALSTDLAGNVSATATSDFIIDDTAPSVTAVTPADNAIGVLVTDNIVITLSETVQAGTGTFTIDNGAGDVRVIDVNDATQVTVTGNTVTLNPTGDLVGGSNYSVLYDAGVLTDAAGNALAAQINPVAQDFTTAASPVDPTVVVFDLVGGTSSDHSGRVFDANISYTIYVVVDPAAGALNTAPAVGAVGTFGTWASAGNLGADDSIIFTTNTGTITGALGGTATVAQPVAATNTLPSASYAWTGATVNAVAAGVTELGLFTRNTAVATASANLWSGTWAALGDGADAGGIVQATPVGLLTSQGLA